jgi:hypothetical protein
VTRTAGVREQQLLVLPDFESWPVFNDLEKLALLYATAMTHAPVEVSEALFDALRRHLDARQLVELTSAIAWENYRARFDYAFGIEAEGFYRGALCLLPERKTQNEKRFNEYLTETTSPNGALVVAPDLLVSCLPAV